MMAWASVARMRMACLAGLILLSALAFILVSRTYAFDDGANLKDIARYAQDGVSLETLRRHVNPAGPLAYALIAMVGEMLGGQLWSYRLVNVISSALLIWVLLFRRGECLRSLAPLCFLLVNPYLPLASATLLTEMSSLLAFMCGTLLWLSGLERSEGRDGWWRLLAGGLLLGLSITGRQYFIAALPAMAITFLFVLHKYRWNMRLVTWVVVGFSGLLAALPIAGLAILWRGLTSPGMQEGLSYTSVTAKVGFDAVRPLSALLYIGAFLIFPLLFQHCRWRVRLALLVIAVLAGCVIGLLVSSDNLWCASGAGCGPISQIARGLSAKNELAAVAFTMGAAAVGTFGVLLLCASLAGSFAFARLSVTMAFSMLFVVFFIVEQAFVGGNIPFYERYVMQIAPIIGLALGPNTPFSTGRALVGSTPILAFGQIRLWKFF